MKNKPDYSKKPQPTKVISYFCAQCGELMLKVYPYSSFIVPIGKHICKKCIYKNKLKKENGKRTNK